MKFKNILFFFCIFIFKKNIIKSNVFLVVKHEEIIKKSNEKKNQSFFDPSFLLGTLFIPIVILNFIRLINIFVNKNKIEEDIKKFISEIYAYSLRNIKELIQKKNISENDHLKRQIKNNQIIKDILSKNDINSYNDFILNIDLIFSHILKDSLENEKSNNYYIKKYNIITNLCIKINQIKDLSDNDFAKCLCEVIDSFIEFDFFNNYNSKINVNQRPIIWHIKNILFPTYYFYSWRYPFQKGLEEKEKFILNFLKHNYYTLFDLMEDQTRINAATTSIILNSSNN